MRISPIVQAMTLWVGLALSQELETGSLGNATVVTNNPVEKQATATLPEKPFFNNGSLEGNVRGTVIVKSSPNGIGVQYSVFFANLPKEGGPFLYHVHDKPVPEDGNCTSASIHLDPTLRGELTPCNSTFPQTCQVGDLSGKYGKINTDPFEAIYHDEFASMNTDNNASVPDRSIVVHFANKTRITCVNFSVTNSSALNLTAAQYTTLAASGGPGGVQQTSTVPTTSSPPSAADANNGFAANTIIQTIAAAAMVAAFLSI